MKRILIIVSVLLGLSVIGNIILIVTKGVTINNIYHQEQYQNQSQSQLLISLFAERGFLIQKKKELEFDKLDEFLKSLTAYQYLYKDIKQKGNGWIVRYPVIITNPNDTANNPYVQVK